MFLPAAEMLNAVNSVKMNLINKPPEKAPSTEPLPPERDTPPRTPDAIEAKV